MKVELHVNGSLQVILRPEGEVEELVLRQMAEGAAKGRPVKLAAPAAGLDGAVVVSVEV